MTHADDITQADNNKWWTLLVVCIATFMLLIDITIVNVALKSIQDDLGSSFSDLQWVVDAYALALAAFLLTSGSLADIFGRRKIFVIGIGIFAIASLACALSNTPELLNYSRAIQGIGAAAMFSTALALLAQEFTGKDRGTAFGVWGATTGASVAVGPLIGGALTDTFGWESIFFVNVPIALFAIGLTLRKVRESTGLRSDVAIDWIGLVTFSGVLFLLVLALVRGNFEGWNSDFILLCLFASAALLIGFFIAEKKQKHAMLDLQLFKKPTFVGASVAAFSISASIFSMFLYVSLYLQNVLGYSPFETGVRFLPTTLLSFFVAAAAGKASAYVSVKALMGAGLSFIAVGLFLVSILVTPDSSWLSLNTGLCLCGIGIGLTNPPLASTAVSVVEPRRSGMASGINSTFRQIGIATGIAGLGAIFQHQITSHVLDRLGGSFEPPDADAIAQSVTNGQLGDRLALIPDQARGLVIEATRAGFVDALNVISLVAACIALTGAIVVFATVRKRDFVSGGHAPAE